MTGFLCSGPELEEERDEDKLPADPLSKSIPSAAGPPSEDAGISTLLT